MAEQRAPRSRRPPQPHNTLDDLRPLLIGPEQARIRSLEDRLDQRFGEMVADVLPEAVAARTKKGDELAFASEPIVEQSVRRIVARDPGTFADAISPALGPAIRCAVAHALRAALQRFNEALDRSLSLESLRWRVEAARTGRPFAEVVLLRTLLYRVEQVFLIHRETGLLLEHVAADDAPSNDPDQISAMMSALETFTREAFDEDARLERFRVGELAGLVEHGPSAILVAIVRGAVPESYEAILREAIDRTHLEYGAALADFRGETDAFARTRALLSDCLREQRRRPRRPWHVSPRAAVLALVACLLLIAGIDVRAASQRRSRLAAYGAALRGEPGLVVTIAEQRAGHPSFTGLRDPLAADPAAVLSRNGLDPAVAVLRFEPFYSADPRLVDRRAERALHPPPGVSLRYHDGVLEARGVAPRSWIDRMWSAATLLPGVETTDGRRLHDEESVSRARADARALDATELFFPVGSIEVPAAWIDGVARAVVALAGEARALSMTLRIEVTGHTDPTGEAEVNERLARERAEHVVAELVARGAPPGALVARGRGVRADAPDAAHARSATFRVELRPAPEE